jgi:hypothetical protein
MALAKDIKRDIRAAKKIRLPWWALVCVGIGALFVSWLFDVLGRLELAVPAMATAGVLAFALYVKRNLIHRGWFWGTIAIVAAFHVALVSLVPWTTRWVPAVKIAAIGSADLILILALLALLGKFTGGLDSPR